MSAWARLVYILTCKCDEVARLLSSERERKLTMVERLALRGHLLVCGGCRRYKRYLRALSRMLGAEEAEGALEAGTGEGLSEEARARLERAIKDG